MGTKDSNKVIDYLYQLFLVLLGACIALGSSWITHSWQVTKERKELVNYLKGAVQHDIGRVDSFINSLQPYLKDATRQLAGNSFRWQHEAAFLQAVANRAGSLDIPVIKKLTHYVEMVEQSKAFRISLRDSLGSHSGDVGKSFRELQAYVEVLKVQKAAGDELLKEIEKTYH